MKTPPSGLASVNYDTLRGDIASGNGGRFGGAANLEEFMRWQGLTERDEPATYPF